MTESYFTAMCFLDGLRVKLITFGMSYFTAMCFLSELRVKLGVKLGVKLITFGMSLPFLVDLELK